jgi:hypothetical protein
MENKTPATPTLRFFPYNKRSAIILVVLDFLTKSRIDDREFLLPVADEESPL